MVGDLLTFFKVFIGLLLLTAFPSFELVQEQVRYPKWILPQNYNVGALILLESKEDLLSPLLQDQKMSLVEKKSQAYFYGVTGLHGFAGVKINGQWKLHKATQLFAHPKQDFYTYFIPLEKPSLRSASKLRIPASTIDKIYNKTALIRERERQTLSEAVIPIENDNSSPTNHNHLLIDKECWLPPLINPHFTSKFASPRTPPNGSPYHHAGLDLRARKGTPLQSSRSGRVTYAGAATVPGQVIIIDHGDGFFSRYLHLNEILVRKNDWVKKGQIIGKTGDSGRVEAPHLHWEIIWRGLHADPYQIATDWNKICHDEAFADNK